MSNPRVIKKYPNRRLYDTEESRYITLADVRDLVINQIDFQVIDKKSGDDITRPILLQVISEQEAHGEPVMSKDFLSQVIRAYGTAMPGFMGRYLEQSLKMFMSQQQMLRGQMQRVVGVDPVGIVADMTQKNFARFRSLQDEVFDRFMGAGMPSEAAEDTPEKAAPEDEDTPEKR
ncbi:MAG: polyhydroxyalkanoate synthesis repressor PhaR [Pseudomonadota bacterium]